MSDIERGEVIEEGAILGAELFEVFGEGVAAEEFATFFLDFGFSFFDDRGCSVDLALEELKFGLLDVVSHAHLVLDVVSNLIEFLLNRNDGRMAWLINGEKFSQAGFELDTSLFESHEGLDEGFRHGGNSLNESAIGGLSKVGRGWERCGRWCDQCVSG